MSLQHSFADISWKVADWLFPPTCVGCGEAGEVVCEVCQLSIVKLPNQRCLLCGKPLPVSAVCVNCQNNPPAFDHLYCLALYSGVMRKSIHQLKYGRDMGMGRFLAKLIAPDLMNLFGPIDLIIPMPLSAERMKLRGYNQADVITSQLARLTGWKNVPKALRKIKDTESQVHLSVVERLANLDGAFQANSSLVRAKRVLILDDVFTTGATMRQATKALKAAGAASIVAVTIARTLLIHD